jgi:hypothetical protein
MKKWMNYFFSVDFSDVADVLQRFEENQTITGNDAELMSVVFNDHDDKLQADRWVCDHYRQVDYNTHGLVVLYNGENRRSMPTNARFSHVLVLDFGDRDTVPSGRLMIHYNAKESI